MLSFDKEEDNTAAPPAEEEEVGDEDIHLLFHKTFPIPPPIPTSAPPPLIVSRESPLRTTDNAAAFADSIAFRPGDETLAGEPSMALLVVEVLDRPRLVGVSLIEGGMMAALDRGVPGDVGTRGCNGVVRGIPSADDDDSVPGVPTPPCSPTTSPQLPLPRRRCVMIFRKLPPNLFAT